MRNKENDWLYVRSFDDSNCDIIYKYDEKGIATLRKEGLIPNAISVEEQKEDEEECGIVFDFDELATKVEEVEEVEIDVDDIWKAITILSRLNKWDEKILWCLLYASS